MELNPFHLSFAVPDLRTAVQFYVDVLGCKVGRDAGSWLDVLLFGHQLTLHQASEQHPARAIDHFGVLLTEPQWQALIERLQCSGVDFAMPPRVSDVGMPDERGKLLLRDPTGNLIEFKYHANANP
ncbi:MAG: VOC family protein [Luteimonas sp.]